MCFWIFVWLFGKFSLKCDQFNDSICGTLGAWGAWGPCGPGGSWAPCVIGGTGGPSGSAIILLLQLYFPLL